MMSHNIRNLNERSKKMKVRSEITIEENEEELKKMYLREKRGKLKERIHAVYLLKKGDCKNIKDLIGKIPRDRKTVRI